MSELLATYSVDAALLASVLESLPARLRRKLEADTTLASGWMPTVTGDSVSIDAGDDVVLTLDTNDRVVRRPEQLKCSCLLAPACLHRGALLIALTINAEEIPLAEQAAGKPADDTSKGDPAQITTQITTAQLRAAEFVWSSAAPIVTQGITSSGALRIAELLRAANVCRSEGMHVLSRSAIRMAEQLKRRGNNDAAFVLRDACDDLFTVLRDAWMVSQGLSTNEDLGSGRRQFAAQGGLRLFALACEPIDASSGYSGVVTHFVDGDGNAFHISDVMPGGPGQVRAKYATAIRLGDTTITHEKLCRSGLIVSGATVAPDGRLGAGAGVKAAPASQSAITVPSPEQMMAAAVRSIRNRDDGSLVVCRARIVGTTKTAMIVSLLETTDDDNEVPAVFLRIVPPTTQPELPGAANLTLLAKYIGLEVTLVGAVVTNPIRTLRALSFSSVNADDFAMPESWQGRCQIGIDRLEPSMIRFTATKTAQLATEREVDPSVELRRVLERITSGGTLALQNAAVKDVERTATMLQQHGLAHGSALLTALISVSRGTDREVDGRLRPPPASVTAKAWLGAAIWESAFRTELAVRAWHQNGP
jgi:hypothetical protein